MATEGITYDGEISLGGDGPRPQDAIEIACTDPRFLERAAQKKPSFVVRIIQGAYSFPRDWWCAIFYCYMRLGVFGSRAQSDAEGWGRAISTVLRWALNDPSTAARLLRTYLRSKSDSPEFYARIGGGVFTNFASRGGRFGQRILSGPIKGGSMAANFVLANTGAAVLTVKYGGQDIASIFGAMFTGNYRDHVSSEAYTAMFNEALSSNEPLSQEEQDAFIAIVEGVLDCVENPGGYVPTLENSPRNVQPHVPVGQVSSMRPDGVMGSIPQGYETNALDAISENNELWRRW